MPTSPTSRPTSHATKNQPIVASATTVSIESIIGAIVGSIVGVGVIAMILVWFIRDRRRRMKYKNLPIHRSIVHGEPLSASFVKEHLKSSYCFDDDGKTAFDLMCISLKMSWDIIEIWVLNDLPNLKGGDNQSTATGGDVESTRLSKSYIGLDVEQGSDDDPLMNATPMRSYAGYSWYLLVQQQSVEAQSLVSKVLDANPHYISALVNGYDNLKRRFVDVASPICRAIMERSLCLFKRFKPTSDTFAYKSPTSILLFAYDIDGDTKVALKFIQSRVLFDRELDSRRSAGFSRDFVIDVLVSYDEISDAEWTRCCDICPFLADNAASHYCLVLEAGGNNLGVQLLNSTSATKDWIAISRIFRDIIRCVIHVHERGQIHGDLKLKNIVTMDTKVVTNGPTPTLAAGSQIRLIDFDASAPIYGARLMDKVSTAYAAPELFVLDESNGGVMLAPGERTKVLATTAQDVWAVGCILYHLATDNTLFHASDKDMIVSSNDRVALRDWDDSFKAQKLTQVGNGAARRLLYKMLEKDPLKRIAATDILNDLFVKSGYNDTIQAFNIFLSYRVSSDAEHVEKIYEKLSALSMKCWWDRKCLRAGESWKEGFCNGLFESANFVCLVSTGALENMLQLTESSPCDNVLLEWYLAIELHRLGVIKRILPLFIGPKERGTGRYLNYFRSGSHPSSFPQVYVASIYSGVEQYLRNYGFKAPDRLTVAQVMDKLGEFQGYFIEGVLSEVVSTVSHAIVNVVDQ